MNQIVFLKRVFRYFAKLRYLPYLIFGLILNIIIRLFRPIIHIRLGLIHSARIGETASFIETYLCEEDTKKKDRCFDIFFLEDRLCNDVLFQMYSKLIYISPLAKILGITLRVNQSFADSYKYEIRRDLLKNLPLFSHTKPQLTFDEGQKNLGESLLKNIGLAENAKYVCFSARDSNYLNETQPDRDWSYHDYRDADIQNQLPAIEALVDKGYYAVRVGSICENCLETNSSKVIDYSFSDLRSDFMDLYLLAHCEFFIGDTSGIRWIPMIFHKPTIALNLIGQGDAIGLTRPEDLILFKKIWSIKKNGYLNLKEIINIGTDYCRTDYFEKNGLELIENTPEEIKGVVLEMESHIHGNIEYSAEDEHLQDKFKVQLLKGYDTDYVGRLGRDYLIQNKDWYLDQ